MTRRWRSERGQSTAMVIVMLWVLVLFVALVANVGQAVNRRIALQVIADAGAYTGASKMAEGMNHIAYANGVIQDFYALATEAWAVNTAAFATCSGYDGINSAYKGAYQAMNVPIQIINYSYGGAMTPVGVHKEAERVSDYNAWDLFPQEHLSYSEYDFSTETGVIMPSRDLFNLIDIEEVPSWTEDPNSKWPSIPPLGSTGKSSWTQPCLTVCGLVPCVLPETWDFPLWYKRSSSDVRYFVWIAEAPATRSLIYDSIFGPNSVPAMKAAAVARPVGGDIKKGEPQYVAQMVPVKRVMTTGGYITDSRSPGFGGLRQVTH
jgi:hypothetical protein